MKKTIEKLFIGGMKALGTCAYVFCCLYAYVDHKIKEGDRLEKLGMRK